MLLIIVGVSGDPTPKKVGENGQIERDSNQKQVFKVGDEIKRGDAVISVTKVNKDWKSSNPFDKPQSPDNAFVVITVSLSNQGKSDMNLSGFWDFKLEDGNGVQRNEALGGIGLNKLSSGSITSLSPGGKITGDMIYEVSKSSATNLKLHYKPLFSFGDPATIELQ